MKNFYNFKWNSKKYYLPVTILLIYGCGKETNKNTNNNEMITQQETTFKNEYKWKLPELSFYEKKKFMNSVNIVFKDIYVNRVQKIKDLNYDPIIDAKNLDARMSSEEILKNIQMIFTKLRDGHTRFTYPFPAQCFNAFFPLDVKLAYEKSEVNSKRNLIISKVYSVAELAQLGISFNSNEVKNYLNIQPGDQIISISNLGLDLKKKGELSFENALNELGKATFGANEDSFYSVAALYFFRRDGASFELPKGNFTLKIKSSSDGKTVTYYFPWLYLNTQNQLCSEENITSPQNFGTGIKFKVHNTMSIYQTTVINHFINNFNQNEDNNIITKIEEKNGKKIALIKIKSFLPKGLNDNIENDFSALNKVEEEVTDIRNFINENKEHIEGILIDVRDNAGGFESYPQMLANIFTHEFVTNILKQSLVSQLNRDIFFNIGNYAYFSRLDAKHQLVNSLLDTALDMDQMLHDKTKIREIIRRELLLNPANRFDEYEASSLPPFYKKNDNILKPILTTKPVAILTNSNCFSTCEIFTAIFKDRKIARIFSETRRTGGVGSTSMKWNELVTLLNNIENEGILEQTIPNAYLLPKGSDFSFSSSKIYRENNNSEENYIEGNGVLADYVYKVTVDDIKSDDKMILDKIMDDILDKSNSKGFYLNR